MLKGTFIYIPQHTKHVGSGWLVVDSTYKSSQEVNNMLKAYKITAHQLLATQMNLYGSLYIDAKNIFGGAIKENGSLGMNSGSLNGIVNLIQQGVPANPKGLSVLDLLKESGMKSLGGADAKEVETAFNNKKVISVTEWCKKCGVQPQPTAHLLDGGKQMVQTNKGLNDQVTQQLKKMYDTMPNMRPMLLKKAAGLGIDTSCW